MLKGTGGLGSERGRGDKAVADMKARLAAMSNNGMDMTSIVDNLWERHQKAVTGLGHNYEYAERVE